MKTFRKALLLGSAFMVFFLACCDDRESSETSPGGDQSGADGEERDAVLGDGVETDGGTDDGDGESLDGDLSEDDVADGADQCPKWEKTAIPILKAEGRLIKDEYGRSVMLRGINVGSRAKMPPHLPWEGSDLGDETFERDMNRFYDFPADWGMNCIRLTVFWEAIEPARGDYDEDYLTMVEEQVKAAADRGIYVFMDFHQDIYSRILGGSGAPAWALPDPDTEPEPLDDPNWFMKYFGDADVDAAFDHFWSNADGVQDAYIEMAVWFAGRFVSHPNVIGIDLMNEPAPGAAGKADYADWFENFLKPFYEKLGNAIHGVAPGFILFVEPSNLEAGGVDLEVKLPRPALDNLVFSPHYYNPIQFITGRYDGNVAAIMAGLTIWDEVGEEFNTPVLLSEFGFRATADTSSSGNPDEYFPDLYGVMDQLLMHGTFWGHEVTANYWNNEDCSLVNSDWTERTKSTNAVARPFPKFTSGEAISFTYNSQTREVDYSYRTIETGGAPTVVALPARHFPHKPRVTLAFGESLYDSEKRELLVFDRICERGTGAGEEQVIHIAPTGPSSLN